MYVLLETYVCDSCHGFHHDHALLMIVCIDKCMICLLYADESRSCLLLCARRVHVCAVLVRLVAEILRQDGRTCVYLHRTLTDANWFLDSAVPVGPGPRAWRPVLLLWLPCIPLPAWPLALAEPNAEPTNFWPRTSAPWRRAGPRLASWAHADTGPARAQAEPPLAQQGSIGTPGRHTPRWGPPSPGKRRRHQSRQRYTGNPHLDICSSNSSSSRTRNTKMETPPRETDTHRFVSYRFRVCRHG